MPSYKRPGVYISESLTPNATVLAGSTSTAVFLGAHHRGPTDEPVLVESWSQFESVFGGFPPVGSTRSELPFALYNYFSNGGRQAYVGRILGTGATLAAVVLNDRAGVPAPTLRVEAKNVGAWGNDLRISILDRDVANGRFDLLVYKGGTTDAYLQERWTDLSMAASDPRYVEKVINSDTLGSPLITVDDQVSPTAPPLNAPAIVTGVALTGGADGAAPTATQLTTAVTESTSVLDQLSGVLMLNMPGVTDTGVLGSLINYAEAQGTFFVVIDTPAGQTVAQATSYAQSLASSPYAAVYYPWVTVPDPSSNVPGATRLAPPGALVCGKIADTDAARGVWKAPAGLETRLAGVLSIEQTFRSADLDALNEGHTNAIRQIPGAGVVIMGARTLGRGTDDKYVNVRRTLNFIKDTLQRSTEFAAFENNDETLWALLESVCSRFLGDLHSQGGLKGATPGQAFYVKCDGTLNTEQVIAAGEVRIEVGVALQRPAEFVVIRIGQWSGGTAATEA